MENSTLSRRQAIRQKQTALLYNGLKFSSAGTVATALAVTFTIGPRSDQQTAWLWFTAILLINVARWYSCLLYQRVPENATFNPRWHIQFNVGALLATIVWASIMWLIYPIGHPAYQALTILALAGVVGGALASLPYDKNVITTFQAIIFVSIESRLLWEGDQFSYELAILGFLLFGFLIRGGREIGKNYYDLLSLRQDNEDTNLTLIKTTEEMARMGYWQWDMLSSKIKLSQNLARMWGFSEQTVELKRCIDLVHTDDRHRVKQVVESVGIAGNESAVEYRMFDPVKNQHLNMNQVIKRISDSHGRNYLLGTVQDISAIKSAEQKIYKMAYYDDLTSLANRGHFLEHLKQQVLTTGRKQEKFAVVYIDLDDFKEINDSFGHECGDKYLMAFADHLKEQLRESDFIARLGGDEFSIVLHDLRNNDEVMHATQRCLAFMRQVIHVNNHRINPKMSIGIAMYPEDGTESDALLRAADMAMYSVKHNGKHGYAFYNQQMASDTSDRVKLEADLRLAMKNHEFELWYQPKISLSDGNLTGVEALIRWRHPTRGLVRPDLFISTTERVGMIKEIGEWVLKTACQQLKTWEKQGINLQMAINISSSHFITEGFTDYVIENVSEYGLLDGELEIEITESMSRDPEEHTRICHVLRQAGVKIAIDDFGTGYSSLSVLADLEVDTLKIDRSFISGLPENSSSVLMVRAIVDLSLGLGYDIVAEGVETIEQMQFLQALNCPYVQGYYFSKPVVAEEIPNLIYKNWLSDSPLMEPLLEITQKAANG